MEVSLDDGATWQRADGAATWTFPLQVDEGSYTIRTRATDVAGNVETPGAGVTVTADATAPTVTLDAPSTPIVPTRDSQGQWSAPLSGTASDAAGLAEGAVEVRLVAQSDTGPLTGWQPATLDGTQWSIEYRFPPDMGDPTGGYTVNVRATDSVGNRSADDAATATLALDSAGPVATLSASDAERTSIGESVQITGLITDTNSLAGLDTLEIAFTPVSQVGALDSGTFTGDAEPQLDRDWYPVSLTQRGAGVATSAWSFTLPAGLEDLYQIDMRGTDMLGNVHVSANLWRGPIDTLAPRVAISATATGASYFDPATNQQMHEIRFTCGVVDRYLSDESFDCSGNSVQAPTLTFADDPIMQALFPDLTILEGLSNSWTVWEPTTTPSASASACDSFDKCATASVGAAAAGPDGPRGTSPFETLSRADAKAALNARSLLPTGANPEAGPPAALIVAPASGEYVAATDSIQVTLAAQADQSLREVTLALDGTDVQTLSFAQAATVQRTQRTVTVPVAGEGTHTLEVRATDWAGGTQVTPFSLQFTLDSAAPALTLDSEPLTVADTYGLGSDMLRFGGTASDAVGLASVQIKVGNNPFVEATFSNGTWQSALPVSDPEGATLAVTVRAWDFAGRVTEVSNSIATDLTTASPPDTTISAAPTDPSTVDPVVFTFEGIAGAQGVAAFECRMDGGAFALCASPTSYASLSVGSHTFEVRARDESGNADLSPASHTWSVSAIQPATTLTEQPPSSGTSRNVTFEWTGAAGASSFECALDGAAYSACSSPHAYSTLAYGEHTFMVRALTALGVAGSPTAYRWQIVNAPPVAQSDTVEGSEDSPSYIQLVATDGDPLTYKLVTPPSHGVLVGVPPTLTYLPDSNANGVDTFTFRASDGQETSTVATVTLNIAPVNDAPLAAGDAYTMDEDTPLDVLVGEGLLANDSDVEGATLSALLVVGPTHGTLTLEPDGAFRYTPDADFNGADSFTYRASDGELASALTSVTLTINAIEDAPRPAADAYETDEDTPLTVAASDGVLANDVEVDGDPLTATQVDGPTHGTLEFEPDGSFRYTPDANYNGPDSFTYQVSDGKATVGATTVQLTVRSVNDAPVAVGEAFTTDEDIPLIVAASEGLLANDEDVEDDTLSALLVEGPAHGTLVLEPTGAFRYTPDADFNGPDSFSYRASDGDLLSAVTTVNLTINPVNDAPVAVGDAFSTDEDTVLAVTANNGLLANDRDVDGDALTVTLVAAPSFGTLQLNRDGSFTYTPRANYHGSDSFTYQASDGALLSAVTRVNLTIRSVNDAPVCTAARANTPVVWPPNGKWVSISMLGVTDVDGDVTTNQVTAIRQDEAVNAPGSGNTSPDGEIVGNVARVRAERVGSGNGRVYHIYFTASDGNGGTCQGDITVGVPKSNGATAVDDGPLYDSTRRP